MGPSHLRDRRGDPPLVDTRRPFPQDGRDRAEIAGTEVAAGDKVVLLYNAANRDETVFEDPYRFDIGRAPNLHFTFGGGGPNHCVEAHLARLEILLLFEELFVRFADVRLAGEPVYMHSMFFNGVKALPCEFTTRSRQRL